MKGGSTAAWLARVDPVNESHHLLLRHVAAELGLDGAGMDGPPRRTPRALWRRSNSTAKRTLAVFERP